jgi:hypothetical protein
MKSFDIIAEKHPKVKKLLKIDDKSQRNLI